MTSIDGSGKAWGIAGIAAALLLCAGTPAQASLVINPTFGSSIASSPDAAVVEGAINAGIAAIENDITSPNPLTVNILFNSMSTGLGQSQTTEYALPYFFYYGAYQAIATSPDQLSALASLGLAPTSPSSGNPVNGSANIDITSAEGRNLGFATPGALDADGNVGTGGTFDSIISLNTSITSPPNPLSGNFGLEAVAMHEMDEALGIGGAGSNLTGTGSLTGDIGDLDLFRYSAPGVRSYSNTQTSSPLAYLSIDGGSTVVSYFNQTAGADFGDWLSNPIPAGFGPQVQDAFGEPGTNPALGPSELTAFNIIGYDVLTPEPSSLLLGGLGLALSYGLVRRRQTPA